MTAPPATVRSPSAASQARNEPSGMADLAGRSADRDTIGVQRCGVCVVHVFVHAAALAEDFRDVV